MSVGEFLQPVNGSQTASVYKGAVNDSVQVLGALGNNFAPHQAATANMTVVVEPGVLNRVSKAQQTSPTIVAPSVNPRIDRIGINSVTGDLSVLTGTESASPVAPDIPPNFYPICQVQLEITTTFIGNSMLTDERIMHVFPPVDPAISDLYITTWEENAASGNLGWQSVTWAEELDLFVAVAGGALGVMTSPDGITWTNRTPSSDRNWEDVVWAPELGLLCAVADSGTGNRVMTSSDGTTWANKTAAQEIQWQALAWSPELGLFVAVADSGTDRVMTSPDGTTWTTRTPDDDNNWRDVVWAPELGIFCAISSDGTNRAMISSNGTSWTGYPVSVANTYTGITWSPELGLFAAVAATGTADQVITSPDGINWTTQTTPANNAWRDITWGSGLNQFIAVANSGTGDRIMSSANGVDWEVRDDYTTDRAWFASAYSKKLDRFAVVCSQLSNNFVMVSR